MRTRSLKVIDMAVHKVAVITPEKSIRESARQMRVEHIGMLTDRDITIEGVARGVDVDQTTVRDLMTAPVVTATESEGMVTALARMREFGIRRLPIIDSEGKLVGVVTNSNLIKELSELLDGLVRNISSSKTREVALRSDI